MICPVISKGQEDIKDVKWRYYLPRFDSCKEINLDLSCCPRGQGDMGGKWVPSTINLNLFYEKEFYP